MALTVNTNIINDTDQYLLDAKNVKGSYVVVGSTTERDSLPAATTVVGSLCYCTGNSTFYQYNGTSWVVKEFGTTTAATTSAAGLMSATDKTKLDGIATGAEVNVQSDWNETITSSDAFIKNKPALKTVATSGNYNDLTNTPTIPTVNNATLTIQKNGINVATFTANSSTNQTANITVPTGAAADKGVDTSISAASKSTNLPTSQAVAAFVEGKGYKTTDTTYTVATQSKDGLMSSTDKANLDTITAKIKISGTVASAVGGVDKDKVYTNADIGTILSDLLFYAKPSGLSISTSASSGTKEYGESVSITTVTPSFTLGSKPITSIKIGTTSDGSNLYSGTSATSGTAITLTTSKTFSGTTGGTIYCTISDGTTSISDSATVSYDYFTYYAVTNSTNAPGAFDSAKSNEENRTAGNWVPVGSTSIEDISITANKGQYVWIASSKNKTGICELNELSDKYNSVSDTAKFDTRSLTNSKNHTCTNKYYFYRLRDPRAGSGTSKFKLA